MAKFNVYVTFDYVGYADCYRGHGHSSRYDSDVLACIFFEIPISYRETVFDVIQSILDDINGRIEPIQFLNEAEENIELQREISEFLTDEVLERAIRNAIGDYKDSEPFFEDNSEDTEELADSLELPSLIGYIHVYRA